MNGTFVDAEGKFAALQALEFAKALFYFIAQVEQALGVVLQQRSGVGQAHWTRAADE